MFYKNVEELEMWQSLEKLSKNFVLFTSDPQALGRILAL